MHSRLSVHRATRVVLLALTAILVSSSAVFAQAVISGVVKDASGAVLPGVTVEAASPALIEKVKSGVTDGAGQYRIVDLRPGSYDVTFSLTGFSTVKREGITLAGTATATVNADLKVGSVAETITVTGTAPQVDVQGVVAEHSLPHELLDSVPTARMIHQVATLIPGMNIQAGSANPNVGDVGGSSLGFTPQAFIHGGTAGDQRPLIEGLALVSPSSTNATDFQVNQASIQELNIEVAALSAEDYSGGVRMNIIPREGGNQFHTLIFGDWAGPSLQSANYTDDLKARGFPTPNPLKPLIRNYNINPSVGGPLVKDKLWFFGAVNRTRQATYVAGVSPNLNVGDPTQWLYVADPNATLATNDIKFWGENARLTWQANQKNKIAVYFDTQVRCSCPQGGAGLAPEAQPERVLPVMRFTSVSWTAPLSNKLVVDLAALNKYEPSRTTGALHLNAALIPVTDTGTGIGYRNYGSETGSSFHKNYNTRGSLSYVTGSHAMKAGFSTVWNTNSPTNDIGPSELMYRFTNGVPNTVVEFADPRESRTDSSELGLFIQDRWTVKRLTLTGGLRFDGYKTSFPDETFGPTLLTPSRNITFPAHDGANMKDLSWRSGAALDVFGNGKTAVKISLNKYVTDMNTGSGGVDYNFGYRLNPGNLIAASTTRSWNDANKNFIPDCNLQLPTANGECGALADQTFGQQNTSNTYDPAIYNGWQKRLDNWEFLTGVQQQVLDRVSMDLTYIRRAYGNTIVTDNLAVAPSDFTQFSIVVPVDSRLPGGGGNTLTGLYNVNPNKFGQTNNFTTAADNYGNIVQVWQGFDYSANIRAMHGLTLQAGLSTGSIHRDVCALKTAVPEYSRTLSSPFPATSATDPWCNWTTNWTTQIKGLGTYNVPKADVQVGVAFQSMPGPQLFANFNATNAVTQPSLGRPLAGGAANVVVGLIEPGSLYGERMNTIDLRLGKLFKFAGRGRVSTNIDIFNLFNASTVLIENSTYSPTTTTWRTPQTVIAGRLLKFSAQFDF